jgi:hypothetical protein
MSEIFRTRSVTDGRVTILANQIMQDTRLSFRARGIGGSAISYPRDWDWSAEKLAQHSPTEGRDAIRSALKELETFGYLKRSRHKGPDGRWVWSWQLRDTPLPDVSAGQSIDGLSVDGLTSENPPATDYPSMVPPGETNVYAGRTIDGSTVDGSSVDIPKEDLPKEEEKNKKPTNQRSYGSVGTREAPVVVGDASQVQDQTQTPKPAPTDQCSEASRLLDSLPAVFRVEPGSKTRRDVEVAVAGLLSSGWGFRELLDNLGFGPERLSSGSNPVGILRWRVQEAAKRGVKPVASSVVGGDRGRFNGFEFPWCGRCSPPSGRWLYPDGERVRCRCAFEFVESRARRFGRTDSSAVSSSESAQNGFGVPQSSNSGLVGSESISAGSVVGVVGGLPSVAELRSASSGKTS